MRKPATFVASAASVLAIVGSLALAPSVSLAQDSGEKPSVVEQGKKIAFDRKKGNCLACHMIAGGDLPGNIGPPLVAMKARFPNKADLRAQIYDSRKANPDTVMPPYGAHKIVTDEELDKIVEFIYTL